MKNLMLLTVVFASFSSFNAFAESAVGSGSSTKSGEAACSYAKSDAARLVKCQEGSVINTVIENCPTPVLTEAPERSGGESVWSAEATARWSCN